MRVSLGDAFHVTAHEQTKVQFDPSAVIEKMMIKFSLSKALYLPEAYMNRISCRELVAKGTD